MPRLIDALPFMKAGWHLVRTGKNNEYLASLSLADVPTVDAYTEEQVAQIIKQADKLAAKANELEKEVVWLKSCLNCKIRKECPRHCGKVVHNCDHWEYGDNAVEVVHGRWIYECYSYSTPRCSVCDWSMPYSEDSILDARNYCPNCGAKMDGDGNG